MHRIALSHAEGAARALHTTSHHRTQPKTKINNRKSKIENCKHFLQMKYNWLRMRYRKTLNNYFGSQQWQRRYQLNIHVCQVCALFLLMFTPSCIEIVLRSRQPKQTANMCFSFHFFLSSILLFLLCCFVYSHFMVVSPIIDRCEIPLQIIISYSTFIQFWFWFLIPFSGRKFMCVHTAHFIFDMFFFDFNVQCI